MAQLEIFYFILTFLVGIVSLGFIFFFYVTTKELKVKSFFVLYITFTLINIFNFGTSYFRANIDDYKGAIYNLLLYFENPVAFTFMIFALPYFIHTLLELRDQERRNKFFFIIALLTFITHNSLVFVGEQGWVFGKISLVKNFVFILIVIYCWIILLKYTNVNHSSKDRFERRFAFYWGLLLPMIINDTLLLEITGIKVFPLVYAIIGVVFVNYFFKYTYLKSAKNTKVGDNEAISNMLIESFSLTSREIEVVKCLWEGKSYKKISEEMFISINTVKTHIKNIYPKLKVSSRHEIVNLIRDKGIS